MMLFKEILLVEDDSIFQLIAQKMLVKHGFTERVVIASNGREALTYLTDHGLLNHESSPGQWPGLVLLDVNMPLMNGFQLLQALQDLKAEEFIRSKVVMLSSSSNVSDKQNALRFGVKAYLEKPLSAEQLRTML